MPESPPTRSNAEYDAQAAIVCLALMNGLGRPRDLLWVSAVQLWENHFRVTVQTGPDAASIRIAHNFFMAADQRGKVLDSSPPVTRLY